MTKLDLRKPSTNAFWSVPIPYTTLTWAKYVACPIPGIFWCFNWFGEVASIQKIFREEGGV